MKASEEKLSLANLGQGAAIEKFDRELQKVLDNIQDPNTGATAKRSVTLTVSLKPNDDREFADIDIAVKSTTAPDYAFRVMAGLGRDIHGAAEAYEWIKQEQPELPMGGNVRELRVDKGGES